MQTLSVTIEKKVEKKFEKLLTDYGYEFSKHTVCEKSEEAEQTHEVAFVLTSEEEFDLVEIGLLNECARQFKKLEEIDIANYKEVSRHGKEKPVSDRSLLDVSSSKHRN